MVVVIMMMVMVFAGPSKRFFWQRERCRVSTIWVR
jgi:hypothetical protein